MRVEEHPLGEQDGHARVLEDLSPEARRKRALRWRAGLEEQVGPDGRFWASRVYRVVSRVWHGAWNDGFIHAGNLAYMAILALFPFFVTVAAIFALLGEEAQRQASVQAFLVAVPPVVARVLEPVASDVIVARSGWLLWAGGLVGLWTVGSLIETIRDILRRAYGTPPAQAFWRHRLVSTGVIVAAVVALLISLFAQVAIGTAEQVIEAWFPRASGWTSTLATSRIVPALLLYGALYALFYTLTPAAYRARRYPKWPGALLVSLWWIAVMIALPWVLARFFTYDLTYGSLAGVMIALFFFWLVGLGMVVGAELNAALAVTPEEGEMIGQPGRIGAGPA
ncbi:YihY/virulence factor BrkB family protein [Novosphingobium sp.]|uniref:YihY/virulence factor BrkB family protein n=1 Tax=Novosphingobium sp. TaxID=1874826 RepID=UPI001EB826B8|nr:YihY/virulence factor BrkB family protein [Novosphingobium sp.]MBK6802844.1 YihY/virulence factor BrkB family protein [Novosphingobium sp.]MBK9012309.1 YihY/virulence factor BrkB family protein [Novosphingobium sp.]